MAKVIWKAELNITGEQSVMMPEGATALYAAAQYGSVSAWFLVDPSHKKKPFPIRVIGTGYMFDDADKWRHLSTVLTNNDAFVWHIFVPVEVSR